MKSRILFWLISFLSMGLLFSCSSKEENSSKEDNEPTGTIEFKMNVQEMTKAVDGCLTDDSLKTLANAGLLKATLTVKKATKTDPEDILLNVRYVNGGFVADPVELPRGANIVSQFTVHHQNNDLYFSSVSEGARYSQYVTQTLPQTITINDNNLYKKTSFDVYVLCTFSENAEDFGYIKWNIHFVRLYCLPFSVNVCNAAGEDVVGTGTLKVEKGDYAGGVFSNAVELSNITFPPATPGALSDLCFPYDNLTNPATTYLRITMHINETNQTVASVVSVAELLTYKDQPEWSTEFNYLHFWFCNCETWFLPNDCDETCSDNMDIDMSVLTLPTMGTALQYYNGTTWVSGAGTSYFDANQDVLVLMLNARFRTTNAVRMYNVTSNSRITIKTGVHPATTGTVELAFTVKLIDHDTDQTISTKQVLSVGGSGFFTFEFNSSDFPQMVDGKCYKLEIQTVGRQVYLNRLQVQKTVFPVIS